MHRIRRRRAACLLAATLLACCQGRPALYRPGEPTPAQWQRLKEAERDYRAGDAGLPALRDELAGDPVTALWFTRMVVRDLLVAREARETGHEVQRVRSNEVEAATRDRAESEGGDPLRRAVLGSKDPVEVRALEQIDALGAAAAPCIVQDLARHSQTYVRQLGVELLGRIGKGALPGMRELRDSAVPLERRTWALAVGAMPKDEATFALLGAIADDGDYTVRAAALRGMTGGGPAALTLLTRALAQDADPFVRRNAAGALASYRDPEAAVALIDYLERCLRERDSRGEEAAQEALQSLARARGPRTVAAWRAWARSPGPAASK